MTGNHQVRCGSCIGRQSSEHLTPSHSAEKKYSRVMAYWISAKAARNEGVVLSYASRLLYCSSFVWSQV
jgi:hypothetical protein